MKLESSKEWDSYWIKLKDSYLANLYRKLFLARPMSKMFDKYFNPTGTYIEAGSGSSTTSCYIKKRKRKMIALDFSKKALELAKKQPNIDEVVFADIRKMPFKNNSIDGIWNLGVMEHFSKKDIFLILKEFHRVLKPKSRMILLWPARYNIVNNIMPWMFPPMPNELKSCAQGRKFLKDNKFKCLKTKITIMGDIILVGEKI